MWTTEWRRKFLILYYLVTTPFFYGLQCTPFCCRPNWRFCMCACLNVYVLKRPGRTDVTLKKETGGKSKDLRVPIGHNSRKWTPRYGSRCQSPLSPKPQRCEVSPTRHEARWVLLRSRCCGHEGLGTYSSTLHTSHVRGRGVLRTTSSRLFGSHCCSYCVTTGTGHPGLTGDRSESPSGPNRRSLSNLRKDCGWGSSVFRSLYGVGGKTRGYLDGKSLYSFVKLW